MQSRDPKTSNIFWFISNLLHKFTQKPPYTSINLNPRTSASEKRFKYPNICVCLYRSEFILFFRGDPNKMNKIYLYYFFGFQGTPFLQFSFIYSYILYSFFCCWAYFVGQIYKIYQLIYIHVKHFFLLLYYIIITINICSVCEYIVGRTVSSIRKE